MGQTAEELAASHPVAKSEIRAHRRFDKFSAPTVVPNKPAPACTNATEIGATTHRRSDTQKSFAVRPHRSVSAGPVPPKVSPVLPPAAAAAAAVPSLRALSAEEESLERSLLRLDF